MSDDQLDKEFKNRLKQVFDNYEDDTGAEGWAVLREKYPEKSSDRVVAWLWRYVGVAAILLAVLSIALWFNMQQHKGDKNIVVKNNANTSAAPVKQAAIAKNKTNTTDKKANLAYEKPARDEKTRNNNVNAANLSPAVVQLTRRKKNTVKNTASGPAVNHVNVAATVVKPNISTIPGNTNNNTKGIIAANNTAPAVNKGTADASEPAVKNDATFVKGYSGGGTAYVKPPSELFSFQGDTAKSGKAVAKNNTSPQNKTTSAVAQKRPDIQSLFANDSKYNNAQTDVKVKNRRVIFGIYAATYVNYAKGSSNQFNTGAGITTDIKLTRNLSLATGVSIAQNSLNYNSLTSNTQLLADASASHNFQPAMLAFSQVAPTSRNLDANLVGLDVPVDLKYMFNPQKSTAYIAAGLSSGTFINQTYNYSYSYSLDNSPSNQQSQGTTTRKTFDDFYFAKMLNVSFGMGYPLGKGNQLIIEPFFKYPLNGLGDQHILFGSGGVNLKLNFDPPKGKH